MLDEALVALARRTVVEEHDGVAVFDVVADAVLAEVAMPDWRDDSRRERVEEVLKEAVYSERGALRFVGADQLVDLSTVTAGLALTHVLSEDEIASDGLSLDPNLGLLADWAEIDGGLHLPDGTRLRLRTRRERHAGRGGVTRITNTLVGPAGWLRSHQPGDLVVARCRDGFLELGPIVEAELVAPPRDLDSRFGELFDIVNVEDGSPIEISEIVVAAAVSGWDLFRQPTRPMGELVASAGFEIEGKTMGRPGSWEDQAELSEAIGMIMRSQHMDKGESLLVAEAVKAAREAISSGAGLPRLLVQRMREHWPACFAIYDELRRGSQPVDAAALDRLGDATGGPVGLWLQGRAAAIEGRGIVAAELAQAAVDADLAFGPAVNDLAHCASDRGEARTAANLLHRVRFPDDPQLERLRDLASSQHPVVGRNDPCSCGSGRKYKHCHAGRDLLPDGERVHWLLSKAIAHLRLTAPPQLLDDFEGPSLSAPQHTGLGTDILLFEDGWMARFLEARGALLPDPEPAWAARWADEHRPLLGRLVGPGPSGGFILEDQASGERVEVHGFPSAAEAWVDRLLWCRLLPVGDRVYCSAGIRLVWLSERDDLLAALNQARSPEQWRDALLAESDGPTLVTTSGEPMMQCQLAVRFDAEATETVAAALTALFGEADVLDDAGEIREWTSKADTDTLQGVLTATYVLRPGRLSVRTSSLARIEVARRVVDEVVPDHTVELDERVPMARFDARIADELAVERLLSVARTRAVQPDGLDAELYEDEFDDEFEDDEFEDEFDDDQDVEVDPKVLELLRAQDDRWLDVHIPALGGHTPRQAAADPKLRADLRTLLAEMEGRSLTPVDDLRKRLNLID